jgi:uncharacterized protein (TIGR02246 family)
MIGSLARGLMIAAGLALAIPAHAEQSGGRVSAAELSDREEIRNLLLEYGRSLDERRLEDYANLFAEEGAWEGGFGVAEGRAAILAMMQKSLGASPPDPAHPNYHVMTNIIVDTDGDTGTAWSRWTFYMKSADGQAVVGSAGRYEDTLVRRDGEWKILRRKTHADIYYRPERETAPSQ